MTKTYSRLLVILFLSIGSGAFAQPIGKIPQFLEITKTPNFYKMQKKAERYFEKRRQSAKKAEEIDTTDTPFESDIHIGGREEDNEYHRYKRWEWYWSERINPDGTFPDVLKTFEVYKAMQATSKNADATSPWSSISRKTNTGGYWGMGRTESVAINPKNSNTYFTTSNGGGVWKTNNGGKTYKPVGDQLPMLFCGKVLIDHKDTNTVYVSLGDDHVNNGGGLGVYKSTDGGATWNVTGLTGTRTSLINIKFMAMNPVNSKIILAATNKGLYRTMDGGTTWTVVRAGSHCDVAFCPKSGTTAYATTTTQAYRTLDGGATWTVETALTGTANQIRIATTEADTNYVALGVFKSGSVNEMHVSTNKGGDFAFLANMGDGCELHVSNANKNNVYCGCIDNFKSTDGGKTWAAFTHWSGQNGLKEVHADNHGINFDPRKPWEIYVSNDGGIDRYNEQTNTWTYLSNGLEISMYYQMGVAQTNPVVIAGGTQDNGGMMRKRDGTWRNTTGGDANMCLIDPTNDNIQYSAYINGGGISRTTNAWTNRTSLDAAILASGVLEADGDWVTPFALHEANPRIIIAGYKDVIFSNNRGDTWTKISTNLSTTNLKKIAISATDSNYIYTADGSKFFRTTNKGGAWTQSTHPGGSVTGLIVHPTDPKIVYTTNNGGNGKRVYKSSDAGTTWVNISAGLPNDISVTRIAYDKNSNEGLYVGTMAGMFYKDALMPSWIYYGVGMPNTDITDIQISYAAKKVRVATYGRGIWENDLYSSAVVTDLKEIAGSNAAAMEVYPNPFSNGFYLSESAYVSKMRIRSLSGAIVDTPVMDASGFVSTGSLAKGCYLLEITGKDGAVIFKKVVKQEN